MGHQAFDAKTSSIQPHPSVHSSVVGYFVMWQAPGMMKNRFRRTLIALGMLGLILCIAYLNFTEEPLSSSFGHYHAKIRHTTKSTNSSINDFDRSIINRLKLNRTTGVYELDGIPILWQYWHDADRVHLYARLLIEAFQCRNPEFHSLLVHDSSIRTYLPDMQIPSAIFDRLSPNHKSDLFRVHILYKYGGAYADVDTFALDKLVEWYRRLDQYDFVTSDWGNEVTTMSAIGPVRAGTAFFEHWVDAQVRTVSEAGLYGQFDWGVFGPGGVKDFNEPIRRNLTTYLGFNGQETVGRLVEAGLGQRPTALFEDFESTILPLKSTPFLFIHHREMQRLFWRVKSIEELLREGTTVFGAFVGCALLDCEAKYEATRMKKGSGSLLVDPSEVLRALRKLDRSVCEKIRRRPSGL